MGRLIENVEKLDRLAAEDPEIKAAIPRIQFMLIMQNAVRAYEDSEPFEDWSFDKIIERARS